MSTQKFSQIPRFCDSGQVSISCQDLIQCSYDNYIPVTMQIISGSGVVANLELWEHSEVLFLSFSSFLSLPLPFCPLISSTLPSSPLSDGSNFNDFPENQLTIDFAFLCKLACGNATVSPFPFVLISFGGMAFPPHKIFGGTAFPRVSPQTTPLISGCAQVA